MSTTLYVLYIMFGKFYYKNEKLCGQIYFSNTCVIILNYLFYQKYFLNFYFSTQLCINTAIVYMHRFYVFHSFTHFPWQSIASAALFLAAKVEEQPRKLEHVIKVAHLCKNHNNHANFDVNSER